jgi:prepilin-type processing-associated H-X9-DG protein/prepilin-type N-terminal cleavage/methylation domain-containing protein
MFQNELLFHAHQSGYEQLGVVTGVGFHYMTTMKPFRFITSVQTVRAPAFRCRRSSLQKGFSLVELMIVLFLMVALGFMMFGFGSESRQHHQQKLCEENLLKIYVAMQIYANDFGGKLPEKTNAATSEEVLDELVPRYTADTSIFICPGGRDSQIPAGESFLKRKISYAYYMGRRLDNAQDALMSDRQVNTQPKKPGDFIFSTTGHSPGNNHHKYGGNILFCDGHVDMSPPQLTFSLAVTQNVVLLNPKP